MANRGVSRSLFLGGLSVLALLSAEPAFAQQAGKLEEIVVTAQRRAEKLEDVPMSITALTADSVEDRGIKNIHDLGQAVAGVQVNFGGVVTQPAIRGITSLTTGENNVAVYIDGFYQNDNSAISADFANLESIQILKGPQGTLYGRNATGGAILLTTRAPSDVLTGKFEASYGGYDEIKGSGFISGPLSDNVKFSVAGYVRKDHGYYDLLNASGVAVGHAMPTHSYSGRAKLEADLSDNLTATIAYNHLDLSDGRGLLFNYETNRSAALGPVVGRIGQPRTLTTNRTAYLKTYIDEGTLTLKLKTGIGDLTSYSSVTNRRTLNAFDFDGSFLDLSYSENKTSDVEIQQGVDYNIDAIDKLNVIVGGTYFHLRDNAPYGRVYAGNALASVTQGVNYNEGWAVYGNATYKLTDQLSLTFGGRYTHDSRSSRRKTINPTTGATIGLALDTDVLHGSYSNFSPSASLRYEIGPRTNVYASFSRGFRAGQIATITSATTTQVFNIRPEKITAYEVGFKTAGSTVRFDTAAYYYDYTDIQVSITIPNPLAAGAPISLLQNAPKARVYGAEAQLTWNPIEALSLNIGAAWTHARYIKFANASGTGFVAATGSNVAGQAQDWSGQQMARAPDFSATLGADYKIESVFGGSLTASTNVKYTASYVVNNPSLYGPAAAAALQKVQRYRQSAYALVNATLTWADADNHLKAGVWVNNLTNLDYRISRNGSAFGDYGTWAPRRTYGVRLGYGF